MTARERRCPDVEVSEVFGSTGRRTITIVPYDERWPARYEEERIRITSAIGRTARRVEHIGSTSVPGLAAKPVIDIVVTVPDITDEERYVQPLLEAGYELRRRERGHRLLRTPARDVNIHVLEPDDPAVTDYLLLRDRLRADEQDRKRYEELKLELSTRDWPRVNAYADAKTDLIREILARARSSATPAPDSMSAPD